MVVGLCRHQCHLRYKAKCRTEAVEFYVAIQLAIAKAPVHQLRQTLLNLFQRYFLDSHDDSSRSAFAQQHAALEMMRVRELIEQCQCRNLMRSAQRNKIFAQGERIAGDIQHLIETRGQLQCGGVESTARRIDQQRAESILIERNMTQSIEGAPARSEERRVGKNGE